MVFGNISEDYITEIKSYLDCGEFFVAEQVNIPTLYSQLWKCSNGPTIADHAFYEFSLIRLATERETIKIDTHSLNAHSLKKHSAITQSSKNKKVVLIDGIEGAIRLFYVKQPVSL